MLNRTHGIMLGLCLVVLASVDGLLCTLEGPSTAAKGMWPGNNITLNCTVTEDGPADRIAWKKDGHLLENANLVSPATEQNGVSSLMWEGLKLANLTYDDDGQYSCTASKGPDRNEHGYRLHIYAKPKITSPKQSDVNLNYGDSFITTCTAKGWPKPTIRWWKQGSDEDLKYAYVTTVGVMLHKPFADDGLAGMFFCYANNSIGSDLRPVNVKVNEVKPSRHPRVSTPYDHVTAYQYQKLTLRCKGSEVSKKYGLTFWKHNGVQIDQDLTNRRFYLGDQVDMWYTVNNITIKDAGNYTCALRTEKGITSRVIRVDVELNGLPLISVKTPYIYSKLGWSSTLTCTLRYVDIARSTLVWLKKDNMTTQSAGNFKTEIREKHDGTVEYSLTIPNVTLEDFGCYGCHVNTSYGWNSSLVCLFSLHSSKDFTKNLSYASSPTTASTLWRTTIPILLGCVVVCMLGFIAGPLLRRNKSKRAENWGNLANHNGYQYDVFITFSNKDFHWVKSELIPLIEKHNLNYCIHNRDFEPGKTIVDNMAESVYNSRHILAVLSKNYMSSTFCRGELDMALGRNTLMKDSSLIAIRVDEIEKKRLPKELRGKMFLDCYGKGEKHLWESRLAKELIGQDSEEDIKRN